MSRFLALLLSAAIAAPASAEPLVFLADASAVQERILVAQTTETDVDIKRTGAGTYKVTETTRSKPGESYEGGSFALERLTKAQRIFLFSATIIGAGIAANSVRQSNTGAKSLAYVFVVPIGALGGWLAGLLGIGAYGFGHWAFTGEKTAPWGP